jgi:N-acetylmuramoyl-L-alanine amidase
VVLDVTRRVARKVEAGLGVKVVLSRDSDVFVPLRDRTNFANKQRADLFVSIHANAHPQSVSEGVETYFLSSEASDSGARQVAAIENGVSSSRPLRQRGRAQEYPLGPGPVEFQEGRVMAETVLTR